MCSKFFIFHGLQPDTQTAHTTIPAMPCHIIKEVVDDVNRHNVPWSVVEEINGECWVHMRMSMGREGERKGERKGGREGGRKGRWDELRRDNRNEERERWGMKEGREEWFITLTGTTYSGENCDGGVVWCVLSCIWVWDGRKKEERESKDDDVYRMRGRDLKKGTNKKRIR